MSKPNSGRIYDYWLGGKDNLHADRQIADLVAEAQPLLVAGARSNRAFLRRAVAFLARAGLDQVLELGSGIPAAPNVHEIAGQINSETRVAYVDNDPVVLCYARALLVDPPRSIVVEADVRQPERILAHPDVRAHLDLTRPVAVVLSGILHYITDADDPARIVATFRQAMAPGSALVISHVVDDGDDTVSAATRTGAAIYSQTTAPVSLRTRGEVATWFDGFTLVPPGLVDADVWRRAGSRKITAPIVAGVGILDRSDDGD